MRVVRDLCGGFPPIPLDLFYNADHDAAKGNVAYKGQLCKIMEKNDIAYGRFLTNYEKGNSAGTNVFGILEENIGTATGDGYLPTDSDYGMVRRKVTPIFPSTLIRAEYAQKDASSAATDTTERLIAASAGTAAKASATTVSGELIGGWIYWVDGANAGQLHYIKASDASENLTLATATPFAMSASDKVLIILPTFIDDLDFNDTSTDILSDTDDANWSDEVTGIDHWVTAPGLPMQRLDRNKHDAMNIGNAKFYHDFVMGEGNVLVHGIG